MSQREKFLAFVRRRYDEDGLDRIGFILTDMSLYEIRFGEDGSVRENRTDMTEAMYEAMYDVVNDVPDEFLS